MSMTEEAKVISIPSGEVKENSESNNCVAESEETKQTLKSITIERDPVPVESVTIQKQEVNALLAQANLDVQEDGNLKAPSDDEADRSDVSSHSVIQKPAQHTESGASEKVDEKTHSDIDAPTETLLSEAVVKPEMDNIKEEPKEKPQSENSEIKKDDTVVPPKEQNKEMETQQSVTSKPSEELSEEELKAKITLRPSRPPLPSSPPTKRNTCAQSQNMRVETDNHQPVGTTQSRTFGRTGKIEESQQNHTHQKHGLGASVKNAFNTLRKSFKRKSKSKKHEKNFDMEHEPVRELGVSSPESGLYTRYGQDDYHDVQSLESGISLHPSQDMVSTKDFFIKWGFC